MEDFGSESLDFIIVWSGDTSVAYHGMGLGRKIQLDEADVQAIQQQVSGVRIISGTRRSWRCQRHLQRQEQQHAS